MKKGLIIRLIDVVLIILFGFLAISDIQMKRQIRLPGPNNQQEIVDEPKEIFLFIQIDRRDNFTLKRDQAVELKTGNLSELREKLVETANGIYAAGSSPVVIIDPDLNATVQSTISIYDICEEEQLPKSINMQLSKN